MRSPLVALLTFACVATSAQATDYYFNSDARRVEQGDGVANDVAGVPIGTIVEKADAVEFTFEANLEFQAADRVFFVGTKPVRIVVNGNVVIPSGTVFDASASSLQVAAGGGRGGFGNGTGGAGGVGGAGGTGGARGTPGTDTTGINGKDGGPGTSGQDGTLGTDGRANPGLPGFGSLNSGGTPPAPAARNPNISHGGASSATVGKGAIYTALAGNGEDGATIATPANHGESITETGSKGGPGGAGRYLNPYNKLVGGGGGSSGGGGGGAPGGGGGAGGAGGGGGSAAYLPIIGYISGGWGGYGGKGGQGGNGASGSPGGDGGDGGGAFEIAASGSITLGGTLLAKGGNGKPAGSARAPGSGESGAVGVEGTAGTIGIKGDDDILGSFHGGAGAKGQDGGYGEAGGLGGEGGSGGGGAGGTIILRADLGVVKLEGFTVNVSGGSGGGSPAPAGEAGRYLELGEDTSSWPIESGTVLAQSSVSRSLSAAKTLGVSIDQETSNSGDYFLLLPANSDAASGALISSVAENARDGVFATSAVAVTDQDEYWISVSQVGAANPPEGNFNTAFGWFPYSQWLGGVTVTNGNGGAVTAIKGSAETGIALASQFIDNGDGTSELDLTELTPRGASTSASSANGVLLVNSAANEDNYAISEANADGTFTIYSHDNGADGAIYEQDPVSFVYLHKDQIGSGGLVALARVNRDSTTDVAAGTFSLSRGTTGIWYLEIPGQSPETGTLLVTPAASSDPGWALDNLISYEWDSDLDRWNIYGRDINAAAPTAPPLQDSISADEDTFSFAFMETAIRVTNENDKGPGSLRQAIDLAPDGSTIVFDKSLSGRTISFSSGEIAISKSLSIGADSLSRGVTLSGLNAHSIFSVRGASTKVSLSSLTLADGYSTSGGAIIVYNGDLSITDCTLINNEARNGGAISIEGTGTLLLINTTITGNHAEESGGAIYQDGGVLQCAHVTIIDNWCDNIGGGVFNNSGEAVFLNSIIANNAAPDVPDLNMGNVLPIFLGKNLLSSLEGTAVDSPKDNVMVGNPLLAPLLYRGGRTKTFSPLPGSPVIDQALQTDVSSDQRGLGRLIDGDGDGVGAPDIGATEYRGIVITSKSDDGDGSLRQALAETIVDSITFDPTVFDGSSASDIVISTGQLPVETSVSIDASNIPGGVTIRSGKTSRIFNIESGYTVALDSLTLSDGLAPFNRNGGAIYNVGSHLTLRNCVLSGNQATAGGGIANNSAGELAYLNLYRCTVSGNSAMYGGGIYSGGDSGSAAATLDSCLISDNVALSLGGGIYSQIAVGASDLVLTNCTIAKNGALAGAGMALGNNGKAILNSCTILENAAQSQGGGTIVYGGYVVDITNTVVASNTSPLSGPNIELGVATLNFFGANIVPSFTNIGGGTVTGAETILDVDPLLAPLADYGGPTFTAPPLLGSPAIDAAINPTEQVDQRGAARFFDGDRDGEASSDIGAAEYVTSVVTRAADSGEGSLRAAFTNPYSSTVTFDADTFDGSTDAIITLTSGEITLARSLVIDAMDIPGGVTLSGNGNSRIFSTKPGYDITLRNLSLVDGSVPSIGGSITRGGAIENAGSRITLYRCILSNNSAVYGGAIYNENIGATHPGFLHLIECSLNANASTDGGGIYSISEGGSSEIILDRCTLSGNIAENYGSGILSGSIGEDDRSDITLNQCTLSGNFAKNGTVALFFSSDKAEINSCTIAENEASNFGGGISINVTSESALVLSNSIVSGNRAHNGGSDIYLFHAEVEAVGVNIVQSVLNVNSAVHTSSGVFDPSEPLLAPLGNYGGPTQTMVPLPGGRAIDGTIYSFGDIDQRGFLSIRDGDGDGVSFADIGAVENQGAADFVPTTSAAWGVDHDGDGNPYGVEVALGTNPSNSDLKASEALVAQIHTPSGSVFKINRNLQAPPGTVWRLLRSTTGLQAEDFVEIFHFDGVDHDSSDGVEVSVVGDAESFEIIDTTPFTSKVFYRFAANYIPPSGN